MHDSTSRSCVWTETTSGSEMEEDLLKILQIVFADIILSGDNAIVIGMAAASVPEKHRRHAIAFGMVMAALLRIFFAAIASYLLAIPGILFLGGLLLAWVCWRFFHEIRSSQRRATGIEVAAGPGISTSRNQLRSAMVTIIVADVSMSIDNVIAVAAIAREDTTLLVFGLVLAILMMAVCATLIQRILTKYPILSYAGLFFLVYLTVVMLHDGMPEVMGLLGLGSFA